MPFVRIIPYQNPSPLRSHRSPVYICIPWRLKGTGKTIWGWWGVDLFIFSLYVYHNHQGINENLDLIVQTILYETLPYYKIHPSQTPNINHFWIHITSTSNASEQYQTPQKARNYLELGPVYCQCERNCISQLNLLQTSCLPQLKCWLAATKNIFSRS